MADFSLGSSGTGRLECWLNWDAPTQASFHYKLSAEIRNGARNTVGDASWNGNLSGHGNASANWTYSTNGWRTLHEFDVTINKDANGYLTVNAYGHINGANAPYVGAGSASFDVGTTRIGEAPGIAGIVADQIKPTTARLGVEITGHGRGTSSAMRMYYRIQGSGSGWSQTSDQSDVAGYNYWTITGLKPSKTYEYFARVWNNNGDTRDSGISTFKTKGIPGATAVILRLLKI